MKQCVAKCKGFDSLRSECARDPCLAVRMCQTITGKATDCQKWCCQSRGVYVFFIVFFFCLGTLTLAAMYYLYRLHQANVRAGVVVESGEIVECPEIPNEDEAAAARRQKRIVTVNPELLKELGVSSGEAS